MTSDSGEPVRTEQSPYLRNLAMPDVPGLSITDRLGRYLGADFNSIVQNVLLDLGQVRENSGDDHAATAIVSALTDALIELETAARKCRHNVDAVVKRRQRFHQLRRERDAKKSAQQYEKEKQEQAAAAARKALDDRIARARLCCLQNGLALEPLPNYDGRELYRVVTDNLGHRLLPARFDVAGWREVETFRRAGRQYHILPAGTGALERIEAWLQYHCEFEP